MSEVNLVDQTVVRKKLPTRLMKNKVIKSIFFVCTLIGLIVLAILLFDIFRKGIPYLSTDFFTNFSSTSPER